jgi:ELWxxDGT repeat protein
MHIKYFLRKGRPGSLRWFSILFSLIGPMVLAQPGLLRDINPGATGSTPNPLGSGFPGRGYTRVGSTLFFTANNGANGVELWKSDGTTAGTTLVKDIYPGAGSARPSQLTNMNGTLYFAADDGVSGLELWKSDGTAAGTTRVADPNAGPGNTSFLDLKPVNGTLYFTTGFAGEASGNDYRLFKTDGTGGEQLQQPLRRQLAETRALPGQYHRRHDQPLHHRRGRQLLRRGSLAHQPERGHCPCPHRYGCRNGR